MAFKEYAAELQRNLKSGHATELTYYPALKSLLESLDASISVLQNPKKTEHGSPDFLLQKKVSQNGWNLQEFCPKLVLLMDTFSRKKRSEIMRRVRSAGTRPELIVRDIVKQIGIRYRACVGSLPGKPDIVVFPSRRAILVHGCFWHGHCCEAGKLPKSNRDYWKSKQSRNAARDSANLRALRSRGWKLMVLWECEIGTEKRLQRKISRFLRSQREQIKTVV